MVPLLPPTPLSTPLLRIRFTAEELDHISNDVRCVMRLPLFLIRAGLEFSLDIDLLALGKIPLTVFRLFAENDYPVPLCLALLLALLVRPLVTCGDCQVANRRSLLGISDLWISS